MIAVTVGNTGISVEREREWKEKKEREGWRKGGMEGERKKLGGGKE